MARTNREILTHGDQIYGKKKSKKSKAVEALTYDPSSRTEYLTGFHKRKVKRQEEAKKKAEELAHNTKLEERQRIRNERKVQMGKDAEKFKGLMKDIAKFRNGAYQSDDESDDEGPTKETIEGETSDYSDWEGIDDKPPASILKTKTYYDDEDASVTVQTIDTNVDLNKSEEILKESLAKAQKTVDYLSAQQAARVRQKNAGKKKKYRYLSAGERKVRVGKERAKHKKVKA